MFEVIVQRERALFHLLLHLFGVFFRNRLLRFFDQRQNVAHAENTRSHAIGIERFEIFRFFAHADEFDRLARHLLHGKAGAAARIAVQFR